MRHDATTPSGTNGGGTTPPMDAPTVRTPLPVAHATASDPGMRPTGSHPGMRPAAPHAGPVPAPGPVPGPGPEAATPPPWHRVPGDESHRGGAPDAGASAATTITDGPTAFLAAPARPVEEAPGEGGGSWSPMRAVRNRPPRQAALQLRRLDPWSVLKLALVLAVVLFFVWLVAVGVLYGVLDGIGVWDRLNGTYADLVSGEAQDGAAPLISAGSVLGFAALIGAVNSLLFAVAVTIAAFVYNVSADLVGGIEVTLSERD
ncbi:MAG: DUF3566 domain-containing protein [Pseudonocardiales bacterium]|nr:DUF3566 domain-containing protein [Pseudonocardiales bacterium]